MNSIGVDVTKVYTEKPVPFRLGQIFVDPKSEKVYQFVLLGTLIGTVTAGKVLYRVFSGLSTGVTDDISTTSPNFVAGVALATVTSDDYCWLQVWGEHATVAAECADSSNTIASGDTIIGSATLDAACTKVAAGTAPTYAPLGICTAIKTWTTSTVAVFITLIPPS